eukprot:RCo023040
MDGWMDGLIRGAEPTECSLPQQILDLSDDGGGVIALEGVVLPVPPTAVPVGAYVGEPRGQPPLQQPRPKPRPKPRLAVEGLGNQHKPRLPDLLYHLLVDDVEGALVHEAHSDPLFPKSLHGIQAPVQLVPEADDVPRRALAHKVILARHKAVARLGREQVCGAVRSQDVGGLGARAEDEPQPLMSKHGLRDGLHLVEVRGEVQPGHVAELQAVVSEPVVQPKVAGVVRHVVHPRVTEMAQDIRLVHPCHGNLADDHLQESAEGGEDALLLSSEPKPRGGREITALHHPTGDEALREGLAHQLHPRRALQVAVNEEGVLVLPRLGQLFHDGHHGLAPDDAIGGQLGARALVRVPLGGPLDGPEVLHGSLAAAGLQVGNRLVPGNRVVALRGALHTDHPGHHRPADHYGVGPR